MHGAESDFDPIDTVVVWASDNMAWLTRPANDFIVAGVVVPVRDLLTESLAWPTVTAWECWRVKGWRLGLFGGSAVAVIGLIGTWKLSINTLVQVMTAGLIAVAIAVPVGMRAGRKPKAEAALGPVRVPFAGTTIMAAVNQVIVMGLAIVIIAGFAGGGGLGFETIRALTRSLFGLWFEVGLALVLMAMVLDRHTQAWGVRFRPPAGNP
jgi:ABC-type proline/glycine betaine transport system permease subunit